MMLCPSKNKPGDPIVYDLCFENEGLLKVMINPHTNMRGPRGPRKTLKAAQTVIIGISEPTLYVIIHNTEPLSQGALFFLKIHTIIVEPLDSADPATCLVLQAGHGMRHWQSKCTTQSRVTLGCI